jgi:pimeloyl-ACP methyl ester carboxylesterase
MANTQTPPSVAIASTRTYLHQRYECRYDLIAPLEATLSLAPEVPLLLIHPIGVGLSRHFWQRFCNEWQHLGQRNAIYNPDLLGCGESAMPHVAYHPVDWAKQLQTLLTTVIQRSVVVVVQGALLPVAIELATLQPDLVHSLVLCGPPTLALLTQPSSEWQHRLSWAGFDSPLGALFYRYARRSQFLQSFSVRQLFATAEAVDHEWLQMLQQGAQKPASRHAVFSFLAGFWRQDYTAQFRAIRQPTLLVMGDQASSISREGKQETPSERIANYLQYIPHAQPLTLAGRNVLAYESVQDFTTAVRSFVEST